jgi:beta-phosphoglucomutase-like phosphatase (HAD superfamily)
MNEDALQKDGGDKPYFDTKEKVIDREIVFQPTVEDAIEIGLKDKDKNRAAAESCLKLQIGNIRTIQKIGSALRQLRDLLAETQVAVPSSFDLQLQTTTVLAAWAYWEQIIDVDDLEKLEIGDSALVLMDEADAKLSPRQKDLYRRVREYGYSYSDDTDKMIIQFIKTGVIEQDELRLRVQENDAAAAKRQRAETMERAWEVYRCTLRPNTEEVVDALYEAHVLGIEDVQTSHLAQAVGVLRELGAEEKADDLMDRFFGRASRIETYSSYPFQGIIQDHKFLERWKEETEREVPD